MKMGKNLNLIQMQSLQQTAEQEQEFVSLQLKAWDDFLPIEYLLYDMCRTAHLSLQHVLVLGFHSTLRLPKTDKYLNIGGRKYSIIYIL